MIVELEPVELTVIAMAKIYIDAGLPEYAEELGIEMLGWTYGARRDKLRYSLGLVGVHVEGPAYVTSKILFKDLCGAMDGEL